jgi:hypothetical protein
MLGFKKKEGAAPYDQQAAPSDVPILTGPQGLTGRIPIYRESIPSEYDEDGNLIVAEDPAPGQAIPPGCLRVLSLPEGRVTCHADCKGYQRDGGCLAEIIREPLSRGEKVEFEVDQDGYWTVAQ